MTPSAALAALAALAAAVGLAAVAARAASAAPAAPAALAAPADPTAPAAPAAPAALAAPTALAAPADPTAPAVPAAPAAPATQQTEPEEPPRPEHVFRDRLEVHRLTVEVRVVDGRGAVTGLGAEDFRVVLSGRPVAVEAADWRPAAEPPPEPSAAGEPGAPAAGAPPPDGSAAGPPAPAPAPGGLVVIFLQSADFYMESVAEGHMRLLPEIERLIDDLGAGEQAAVLRYGSRLELEMDFTSDRERLRAAVRHALFRIGRPPRPVRGARPSLAAHLDLEAARRAATPARGLAVAAEALTAIPGAKTMVFVGWGLLDSHRRTGVGGEGSDGSDALAALGAARTSVFVLDVTSADWHLLEGGLRHMADVTGGTYSGTYHFPSSARRQLERAMAGTYTLVLRTPRLGPGRYALQVRLAPEADRRGRRVIAPNGVTIAFE